MHLWLRNTNTSWFSISIHVFREWLENYVTIGTLFLTVPQLFVTHLELCCSNLGQHHLATAWKRVPSVSLPHLVVQSLHLFKGICTDLFPRRNGESSYFVNVWQLFFSSHEIYPTVE